MNCSSCGTELPSGAPYCPTCGIPTPYFSNSESSPFEPTASSSSEEAANQPTVAVSPYDPSPQAPPPPPSTAYGSTFYESSQQDPYGSLNPYEVPQQAPVVSRRRVGVGVLIGTAILILILVGAGIFVLLSQGTKNALLGTSPTPTVNSVQNTQATATAQANATLTPGNYPPSNARVALQDPLSNNTNGYGWDRASDAYGGCAFTGGAYHVMTVAGYFRICTAQNTNFANFAYEVQMTIIKGDCGGTFFRAASANTHYYFFRVCQDGSYALFIYFGPAGSTAASQNTSLLSGQASSEINTGLNQVNLVAVVAQGTTINLYVNHQQVDSTTDSTYNQGQIAVASDGFPGHHATEVVYSNAKVWQL